ncbi:MAG: ABC transporter ATP-binding protein, partial [Thermoprotei archaeon]
MREDVVIEVRNLTFRYPFTEKPALKDINLEIRKGEFVGILGPCGAGKTTLCLTLNGIIPNMVQGFIEGEVRVMGMDTRKVPTREIAKYVGMVFDNPEYQLSQMTVEEEVALGLGSLGVPRDEMIKRVREVLKIVGLEGLEKRSPFELSGGQQQRLAIAAALAMMPTVLVLDEPTSNLDPIGKQEVYATVRKLNEERGMTIVMADHEVEFMAAFADRLIVMDKGEIVLNGPPVEVFKHVDLLESIGLRVPQVTELA